MKVLELFKVSHRFFFSMGNTIVTSRASGITRVHKDRLMINIRVGRRAVRQPFKTTMGRGSSSQGLDNGFIENCFISSWVTSSKVYITNCDVWRGRPNVHCWLISSRSWHHLPTFPCLHIFVSCWLFRRKWFEPRSNIPWLKKIIWVIGVLRTVLCDSLCGPEDGFCTGGWNVSHKQQSFSGPQSSRWSIRIPIKLEL